MAETYWPFDAGAGANVTEDAWREMAKLWRPTGVIKAELNGLEAYGDSSGLQVKLKTGAAWNRGHYYKNDAEQVLAIAANASGSTRIDTVVIRADFTGNTIAAAIVQGTPGAGAPALTQTATTWEVRIADVTVINGAATITAAQVVDKRTVSVDPSDPPSCQVKRAADLTLTAGTLTVISWTGTDEWDNDSIHDPSSNSSRLTCKTAGKYKAWMNPYIGDFGNTGYLLLDLLKNGAQLFRWTIGAIGNGDLGADAYREVSLAVGDYLEMRVLSSPVSKTFNASSSRMGMTWVGQS